MRQLQYGETKTVESILPDFEESSEYFKLIFLCQNVTKFETNIKMKRKKLCDCKMKVQTKKLSFRESIFDCIHRNMFVMSIEEPNFEAYSINKLFFDVQYIEPGYNKMAYILFLTENRKLEWIVSFNILVKLFREPSNYSCKTVLNLKPIFLGRKHSPVQAFYFYNNTNNLAWYSLNIEEFYDLESIYNFEIISCMNPDNILLPMDYSLMLIKFSPLTSSLFSITIPMTLGDSNLELQINSKGCMNELEEEIPCQIKRYPYHMNTDAAICLSDDEVVIDKLLIWSTCDILIFIKNLTKDRVIGYRWEQINIEGILSVEVIFNKGILQPKESHGIMIRIHSFDESCNIRIRLPCKLLDHTQYIEHKTSLYEYEKKELELDGQFTINEYGTFYPKNDVVVVEAPVVFRTSLELWIKITHILDRDIYLNVQEQYMQSPQFILKLKTQRLLEGFSEQMNVIEAPISTFAADKMKKEDTVDFLRIDYVQYKPRDCSNFATYKHLNDCILSDLIFSNIFHDIMIKIKSRRSPYYIQFLPENREINNLMHKQSIDNRKDIENKIRRDNVKTFITRAQPPHLARIFTELIADTIHEVFHLGPQIKNRPKPSKLLTKFTLKHVCGCEEFEF